jgi:hypothetical protein
MKRRTLAATAVSLFVVATAALAFYFVAGLGEGEHTGNLGKGQAANYPISVAFADGLVPGAKEPITFTLEPTYVTDVKGLAATITTSNPECKASWFSITTKNGFWKAVLEGTQTNVTNLPVGPTNLESMAAGYELAFKEEASINQGACEGAKVTVKAVASA